MIWNHGIRQKLGRMLIFLMAVAVARGVVSAEQTGQPSVASSESAVSMKGQSELYGPLQVSGDGHFLQHADGTPFFWLADTAWALHQNLSRDDVVRYLDDAAAAGFNMIQLMSVNAWALDDWIEPWYEQCTWKTPPVDDWEVRLQAYQSVFAGACGHTYGHHDIWPFDSPGLEYAKRWREALPAPGRMQMRHLRQLMESQAGRVPLSKFVTPREKQTAEPLLLTQRIAATGGVDGSWAFVYTPRGASFSVDLASLNGPQVTAHWFDPKSGKLQSLGTLDRNRRQTFDPPGEPCPGNDWILVLQ